MKAKATTTHTIIAEQLHVFKRARSAVWQCKYLANGKWIRESTNTKDLAEAKAIATDKFADAKARKRNNLNAVRRYFRSVAKATIKKIEEEIANGRGTQQLSDYIKIIDNYLIKYLGNYYVDNIDYKKLDILDKKRIKDMKRVPSRSTMLNHNAALNRVFDEAIYRGFMTESQRPKLVAKGKASEKREGFTLEEVKVMRKGFDSWIAKGKSDSKELRALLKDYVFVLLDTGARPGKEILNLRWIDIEYKVNLIKTNEKLITDDGVEEEYIKNNPNVYLKIAEAKTKSRIANGYIDTITALRNIAQRNYNKSLFQLLLEKNKDYIFRYREIVTKRQKDKTRVAQFKTPTSFSKLFDEYLTEVGLLYEPSTNKKRVFYSLRHSYATFQLLIENINIEVLAKQMGTSMAMISKFYSDVTAMKATEQLRGNKIYELLNSK